MELEEAIELLERDIQSCKDLIDIRNNEDCEYLQGKIKKWNILLNYIENSVPKKKIEDKMIKLKEYKTKLEKELVNAEIGTDILAIEENISKIESQINLLQELLEDK